VQKVKVLKQFVEIAINHKHFAKAFGFLLEINQ
jgi:hypothetical protein